ncbi:hypothetical protein AB0K15_28445 [Amycolatopsis sp. NPDC049253]|uniref:hypothetical protein n=1 Tax=Amycolatopsis sp. NPDC049253 TaxID=3155274 RepID=UPI00341D8454
MTDEVVVSDRAQVDVDNLPKFDGHVAIPAAEPLEAVYRHDETGDERTATVHGFTADRYALVLNEGLGRLVRARHAARQHETFEGIKPPRTTAGPTGIRGPFTPAPPGMIVVFSDGTTREPIRCFDSLGRPVLIDLEPTSRALYLAQEDEGILRIEGPADSAAG